MKNIYYNADLPIPPVMFCEICMCFDYDFDVNVLDKVIGLKSDEAVRKSETMFNNVSMDNNPGYWTYKTDKFETFEFEGLTTEISRILMANREGFLKAYNEYNPSSFFIRIWICVKESDEYPVINFSRRIINILFSMNIEIDIVVYNDYLEQISEGKPPLE